MCVRARARVCRAHTFWKRQPVYTSTCLNANGVPALQHCGLVVYRVKGRQLVISSIRSTSFSPQAEQMWTSVQLRPIGPRSGSSTPPCTRHDTSEVISLNVVSQLWQKYSVLLTYHRVIFSASIDELVHVKQKCFSVKRAMDRQLHSKAYLLLFQSRTHIHCTRLLVFMNNAMCLNWSSHQCWTHWHRITGRLGRGKQAGSSVDSVYETMPSAFCRLHSTLWAADGCQLTFVFDSPFRFVLRN